MILFSRLDAVSGPCSCERYGNTYTVSLSDNCASFMQSTASLPEMKMACPPGLQFNTDQCVCDYPSNTRCPSTCSSGAATEAPATQSKLFT